MDAEVADIRQHMGRYAPFDGLSDELLDQVAGSVEVAYFRAGRDILVYDQAFSELCYIRSGAVEVFRRNGELYNRLGEGDIFGHFNLLRDRRVRFPARALEDTLIYFIPLQMFEVLCEQDDNFADFVELERPRLQSTAEAYRRNNDMLVTRIRKLVTRSPVLVASDTPVQEAAQRMRSEQVSALLVVGAGDADSRYSYQDREGEFQELLGILTDKDFRDRVVADGLPPETPVSAILGDRLLTVQSNESVYDAMLSMLRNNVHHLPVMYRRWPIGIVHLSDIIRYETQTSLFLVSSISNQSTPRALARLSLDVRSGFVRMSDEGSDSKMIGSAMSTIGRAFTRRLLELAERELGPPPVPYCFMALGSMARNEQLLVSDQDNALILDDRFDARQHDDYFLKLAAFVSDGLDACGYPYCKGHIMATNQKWRQPLHVWKEYFREWITDPSPERLLHSSIFFDLDSVAGEAVFVDALRDTITAMAPQRPLFLAAMARNALNRTPPLGIFRTFVVEMDGQQSRGINLKRRGTAPLVELIRVHALACGSRAQNSFERLDDISKTQLLASGVTERLRYALEYLSMARIHHQAQATRNERAPDNNIDPENVSSSERHNLKEAFQTLNLAQKFLGFRYPMPASGREHSR